VIHLLLKYFQKEMGKLFRIRIKTFHRSKRATQCSRGNRDPVTKLIRISQGVEAEEDQTPHGKRLSKLLN
jgi:hypothetical protein